MRKLLYSTFLFSMLAFSGSAFANVVGTHFQNFNPTTNGLDFVTVHSSKTLDAGTFNLGGFANYAFNSLPYFKNPGIANQQFPEPNDKLLSGDLNLGLGIMKGWDVGLSLPGILRQDVNDTASLGTFDETGLTEVRVNTKVRVVNEENWGLAFVGSVNFDRIKNNPFTGSNAGPTFNLEGAFDYKVAPNMLWAINVGYRLRDQGDVVADTGVMPLDDQILYSTALNYLMSDIDTTLIFELFGSSFTKKTDIPTDRQMSNLEVLIGAKYMILPKMALHFGASTQVYHGLASPDLRLYAGLNWMIGPVWAKDYTPAPVVEPVVYTAAPPVVIEEKPSEVIVLSSINFATNSTDMTASSRGAFQKTAQQLRRNVKTIRKIVVEGHTDNVGTDAFNIRLSEGRAKSVQKILLSALPMLSGQIFEIGLGESRPVATNDNETGRSKNRRVEIKIYRNE
jgi:outer membrane protein OmpA-like peptidoglycan-associated protein